jgi:hypothetical protein
MVVQNDLNLLPSYRSISVKGIDSTSQQDPSPARCQRTLKQDRIDVIA